MLWPKASQKPVNTFDFLQDVPINSWMAFLHFVALLRTYKPLADVIKEVKDSWGLKIYCNTFTEWFNIFQSRLKQACIAGKFMCVCARKQREATRSHGKRFSID